MVPTRLLLFNCLVVTDSFAAPWTVAHQAPLSVGIPSQECWRGCHFLLQGILLTQGLNPSLLHWQENSLQLSHLGSLVSTGYLYLKEILVPNS